MRVSGTQVQAAFKAFGVDSPDPRSACVRWLRHPLTGERVDQAMVLSFVGPHSFTGEDLAEFQVHGSRAVIDAVLSILTGLQGFRIAEPGEFSRRALLNGKLDLVQIEGLGGLLDAETESQRRQAMRQMEGGVSRRIDDWRARVLRSLALVEATIDFSDEDIPTEVVGEVQMALARIGSELSAELRGSHAAERITGGFEVALVGRPNVGKSTLLNFLAQREAAIVSEIAGTTRDVIEVRMDIAGMAVTVLDMAGIRASNDAIEAKGIERARLRATGADLRIFLVASGDGDSLDVDRQPDDILVTAFADVSQPPPKDGVSGLTGIGVDRLIERIGAVLSERAATATSLSTLRQKRAIEAAADSIASAEHLLIDGTDRLELVSEGLRSAVRNLDILTGRVDVEGVLSIIFQSFCLGK